METLKFLMITTHFPPHHLGGDAVFVDYLSRQLSDRGHEVHVLHNPAVFEVIGKTNGLRRSTRVESGVQTHAYEPRFKRIDAMNALMMGLWRKQEKMAAESAKSIHPDVVHWHNTRAFIGGPVVFGDEASLYTSHDYGSICPRSNLLKPDLRMCEDPKMCTLCCLRWGKPPQLWRIFSKRVLRLPPAMRVIAPSEFLANRLRQEGIARVNVLRNFVPDPGLATAGPDWNPESLIYLGMLERHKGLHTLLKAFSMSANQQGFALDIVGTGSLAPEVRSVASRSGLGDRLRIHGFLSREAAENLRRKAVAQVVPSEWFENCPLTVLEAFAMGVPIMGSDIGGIPEIAGPETGSSLFRCGDAAALASAIVKTWEQQNDLRFLRAKARETYETRFRPEIHLDGYMKIINES